MPTPPSTTKDPHHPAANITINQAASLIKSLSILAKAAPHYAADVIAYTILKLCKLDIPTLANAAKTCGEADCKCHETTANTLLTLHTHLSPMADIAEAQMKAKLQKLTSVEALKTQFTDFIKEQLTPQPATPPTPPSASSSTPTSSEPLFLISTQQLPTAPMYWVQSSKGTAEDGKIALTPHKGMAAHFTREQMETHILPVLRLVYPIITSHPAPEPV